MGVEETLRKIIKKAKESEQAITVWGKSGNSYFTERNREKIPQLPVGIYELQMGMGFYLEMIYKEFVFPYKIYGTESNLINRIKKSFDNTVSNMGVIFNGTRGTGKTVTAKQVCNNMQLPVILITEKMEGALSFINSINQDIVIFIDEYEKIYDQSADILAIMDGAVNSQYRRLFLLTTNSLYINENMIQRPGRIRYIKTFKDLKADVIEAIVDDLLINKKFKSDLVLFISGLEIITIDIVKSVIQEVNIHNEPPENFRDVFNVRKMSGKMNISIVDDNNSDKYDTSTDTPLFTSVITNYRSYDPSDEGDTFSMTVNNIGHIKIIKPITRTVVEAQIESDSIYQTHHEKIYEKLVAIGKKPKKKKFSETLTLRIDDAMVFHSSYKPRYFMD